MTLNDILNAIEDVPVVRLIVPVTQRLSATVDVSPDDIAEMDDASARYGTQEVKALRLTWTGSGRTALELDLFTGGKG